MSPSSKRAAGLVAAVILAVSAGAAWAVSSGNTGVIVVNDSGVAMVQLYVGRRQVLGQPVPPGGSVSIDGNEGRGCQATITAVFADGSTRTSQVDVCQVGQINATARGIPICPGDARCKRSG